MNENEVKQFFEEIMPNIRNIQELVYTYGIRDYDLRVTTDGYMTEDVNGYEYQLTRLSDSDDKGRDTYTFSHKGKLKEVVNNAEDNAE